ncbi:MAG: AEC family transporter [Agathobaculum sp.]|jgi:predicted permease|uniref:AEC family transporter n=1 Tax=Agathobaculum sp. TaxID=2048138 RepID=UPI003D909DCA
MKEMEIFGLLTAEVGKLFLMMLLGFLMYRRHVLSVEESKVISKLLLYIVLPCVVFHSFCVEFTMDKARGLVLAYAAAAVISLSLVGLVTLLMKPLRLTTVEEMNILYFNTGIVVPIVISAFGREYVMYATGMIFVHTILVWTHCSSRLSGHPHVNWKKVLCNPNLLCMAVGFVLLLANIQLPVVLSGTIEAVAGLFGPLSMIVTGVLVGSVSWKKMRSYRRLPLIVLLRMVAAPLFAIFLLKVTHAELLAPDGTNILLIVLLAVATNAGSTVTQMVQLYGGDAEYSSIICAVTSVLSIVALPVFGALFEIL